ncbi:MAG: pantoate--beta-alanine ligase [Flavobacteriales bacterium]|nr:pantoate--beta-alanine ligase [Flavobacteriales bacterium]
MFILKTARLLQSRLQTLRNNGLKIGFVPTMGALHAGHISLMERCKSENDITVCSIFVNPKQFNDKSDLDKYPQPIEDDIKMLTAAGVDYLFHPSSDDLYNEDYTDEEIDLDGLDTMFEGALRPGHFQGVAKVVKRFFEIVQPHNAYFGQKDFQQTVVLKTLIKNYDFNINMVVCPIMREPNGLAMSSRNQRLSPDERERASFIYKSLLKLKERTRFKPLAESLESSIKYLTSLKDAELEYLICVDGNTMQEVKSLAEAEYVVALTVVKYGGVRLLDNIILKQP